MATMIKVNKARLAVFIRADESKETQSRSMALVRVIALLFAALAAIYRGNFDHVTGYDTDEQTAAATSWIEPNSAISCWERGRRRRRHACKLLPNAASRCALIAGEGARVPSERLRTPATLIEGERSKLIALIMVS